MKKEEKDRARLLRKEGKSVNEIVKELGVSKASVSVWVRDISLSTEQRTGLTERGRSIDAIEKRRVNRLANTHIKHRSIIDIAKCDIQNISSRELLLIGAALYWGEGGKSKRGLARLSNSDPLVIKIMMRFFREICKVPEERFRAHIHTFSHLNAESAEQYWSEISGIPRNQFYKTYSKISSASKNKKDNLPYGTVQIYVSDTKIFLTILGWIERLGEFAHFNSSPVLETPSITR